MQPILQLLYSFYTKIPISTVQRNTKKVDELKKTIAHQLEITMPDTDKLFHVLPYASNTGIGAALWQQHPTEKKKKNGISKLTII